VEALRDVTFRLAPVDEVAVTASNPTTAAATLPAKKVQAEIDFSGELTEDSIIPAIPASKIAAMASGTRSGLNSSACKSAYESIISRLYTISTCFKELPILNIDRYFVLCCTISVKSAL
jgi:hypothetical protein